MKLTNEFEPIRQWARERGIYNKGDVKTQFIKLQEEVGELAEAILKKEKEELYDAIGDCVIVLTNLAYLVKIDPTFNDMFHDNVFPNIEDCINVSYDVIKTRKGKMENGTFKKES